MKVTIEYIEQLGFKKQDHYFLPIWSFQLGRRRELSVHCLGTGNEMLFITEENSDKIIDDFGAIKRDCIVLHNFDYDGLLTEEKLSLLMDFFKLTK